VAQVLCENLQQQPDGAAAQQVQHFGGLAAIRVQAPHAPGDGDDADRRDAAAVASVLPATQSISLSSSRPQFKRIQPATHLPHKSVHGGLGAATAPVPSTAARPAGGSKDYAVVRSSTSSLPVLGPGIRGSIGGGAKSGGGGGGGKSFNRAATPNGKGKRQA